MKRLRFLDILRHQRLNVKDEDFNSNAEPNPFFNRKRKMSDLVRGSEPRRGLDKVSRSKRGSNAGVSGSRYDDMVRDIEDLEPYMDDDTGFDDSINRFDKDEDDLYLTTNDRSYRRNEFNDEDDIDDFDADAGWEFMRQLDDEFDDDEYGDDINDLMSDEDDEFGEDGEEEESKFDGVVRAIKGASLVSKKQQPDETFTEVWIYNVGEKYDDEANIRKSILSGTDIDPTKNFSEDGSQEAVIKSIGNVQFLTLVGLPD